MAARRATQLIALKRFSQSTRNGVKYRSQQCITSHRQAQRSISARAFSVSSSRPAARDSSSIDFFYFPSIDNNDDDSLDMIRVPILPDNYDPPRTGAHAPEVEFAEVHKPEINTMSLDSVYLPLAENHDGHALGVDFHSMADRVAANVRNMKIPVEEQASMMKQLWNDMVDDILGLKKKVAA